LTNVAYCLLKLSKWGHGAQTLFIQQTMFPQMYGIPCYGCNWNLPKLFASFS